jgi:hypothetical protein
MREDMAKVLVERPRKGGCGKERSRQNRHETRQFCKNVAIDNDLETANFRGMKRVHTSKPNSLDDKKQVNENLNPLRRFLQSRIGQPWDKVYSEIMSRLNLNNAVQYHVWQHLIQLGEVETKTYTEGNTVMAAGLGGPQSMTTSYGREEFYVDPKNGTLRQTKLKSSKYRRDTTPSNESYYDPKQPLTQYHKVDGIWFEFKFREATAEEKKQESFGEMHNDYDRSLNKWERKWRPISNNKFVDQIVAKRNIPGYYRNSKLWAVCKFLFGEAYLPVEKRQISSKEIRKIEELMDERNCRFHSKAA